MILVEMMVLWLHSTLHLVVVVSSCYHQLKSSLLDNLIAPKHRWKGVAS